MIHLGRIEILRLKCQVGVNKFLIDDISNIKDWRVER